MHDRSGNAATPPSAATAVPRGRYAPSPTGPLHLGNIRTALLAWLQIRLAGGVFILRIDDIDAARNRPGGIEQLIDDLRWLGLDWDEGPDIGGPHAPYLQSQRSAIYDAAFQQLRDHGRVFACHCSRKDIALAASAPHERDAHTIYPGTCRAPRSDAGGRASAWRYRVEQRRVRFDDEIAGETVQHMDRDVGDFVIRRADGGYAYQLATAVDDAMMGITDVVRGADLLTSTPRQIEVLRALAMHRRAIGMFRSCSMRRASAWPSATAAPGSPPRVQTAFGRRTWSADSPMGLASSHTSRRSAPASCSTR